MSGDANTHARVETKNLTLHLPLELVRRAKVYAAQHDTSINLNPAVGITVKDCKGL
jgi:hypothetical protein